MTKPNWEIEFEKKFSPIFLSPIRIKIKSFISNLLIQEREAGRCTCGFGKDTAAEIGHFKGCPRYLDETWWQTKQRIRTETIKEVIEKLKEIRTEKYPTDGSIQGNKIAEALNKAHAYAINQAIKELEKL